MSRPAAIIWLFAGILGVMILALTTSDAPPVQAGERVDLSGPTQVMDTPHFRLHYTATGADATTSDYVEQVASTLEAAWKVQVGQMGWAAPPPTERGDDRYHVYIASLKDRDGLLMGYIDNLALIGDNPHSELVEAWAANSYMVIENDFAEMSDLDEDSIDLMRATVAHEFNHAIQMGYDGAELIGWYYEATAVWMEIETFGLGLSALEYIADNFYYPEICLGSLNEAADLGLEYGNWLLIQSLVDRHGPAIARQLWENIAVYEGFEALEQTLAAYDDTVPAALARHHLQTLARHYPFIEQSSARLWLAGVMREAGQWTPDDPGVQELAASFFYLKRPPGLYDIRLNGDDGQLTLWAVGIRDNEARVMPLDRGGTVNNADYDYLYVMVFNPAYDDDLGDCQYVNYSLEVGPGTGRAVAPQFTLDATNFLPLAVR